MDFTPFEKKTIEAIDDCSGAIKHCGKNAIHHLEKAWAIRDLDFEMAMFRGITAEEEAASALFFCLKNNNYKNSHKLLFKEHTYKLGLHPFLRGVGAFLYDFFLRDSAPFDIFHLHHIDKKGRRAIELLLHMPSQGMVARPIPPLHFTVSDPETGDVCTFESSFLELISGSGYDDALKYVKEVAATRNKLLYANNSGRPKIEGDISAFLTQQQKKVMAFLCIVLMVDPWEMEDGTSFFVQQALDSFLLLLARIHAEDVVQPHKKNGIERK